MKIAVIQNKITRDKKANLNHVRELITIASKEAEIIVLPEMFNCPYNAHTFYKYSEEEFSTTTNFLKELSKEKNICIIGGSIPEYFNHKIYNTSYTFDRGKYIGKYRKNHLFDVDIKGKMTFRESDTLSKGTDTLVFNYKGINIAICICFDIRFSNYISDITKEADVLVVPAAFNTTTGPLHWHLLMRARAVDNQIYVVAASPSRSDFLSYKAYGHSLIVDPWGKILSEAMEGEEIIYADIDKDYIHRIRNQMPIR